MRKLLANLPKRGSSATEPTRYYVLRLDPDGGRSDEIKERATVIPHELLDLRPEKPGWMIATIKHGRPLAVREDCVFECSGRTQAERLRRRLAREIEIERLIYWKRITLPTGDVVRRGIAPGGDFVEIVEGIQGLAAVCVAGKRQTIAVSTRRELYQALHAARRQSGAVGPSGGFR